MVLLSLLLNKSVHRVVWILLAAVFVTPGFGQTQPTIADNSKPEVASLVSSPGVCVLEDEQTVCQLDVAFLWEVPDSGDFCLWEEGRDLALSCWQGAWSATLQVQLSAEQDKTYILMDTEQTEVARTTIRVIGELEQRIRARRRSGFWRVF